MKNLILGTLTLFSSISAHAALAPFDVVAYDEGVKTRLLALSADKTQITLFDCPKNEWITSAQQCSIVGDVLPANAFGAFVRETIAGWSTSHVNAGLAPLSAEDVKKFAVSQKALTDPRNATLQAQLKTLNDESRKVDVMLEHMPNSPGFLAQKKEIQAKISTINAELQALGTAQSASLMSLVNELSTSMFKLISENNPKDGNINSFGRSLMKASLLDAVFERLSAALNSDCVATLAKARWKSGDITTVKEKNEFCLNIPKGRLDILKSWIESYPIDRSSLDYLKRKYL